MDLSDVPGIAANGSGVLEKSVVVACHESELTCSWDETSIRSDTSGTAKTPHARFGDERTPITNTEPVRPPPCSLLLPVTLRKVTVGVWGDVHVACFGVSVHGSGQEFKTWDSISLTYGCPCPAPVCLARTLDEVF